MRAPPTWNMSKVAIITGAGRGLGRAFAVRLANNGYKIAAVSRTASELAETVRQAGNGAIAITADVTSEHAVAKMAAEVEQRLGPVDVLINNAGIGPPFGPTWESAAGEWWRNIEVNLKGPMLCCRAVLPGMIARRIGRIINIASGAGTMNIPYMSAYISSKAALIQLTGVLNEEVRPHGISVFAVQPGTVRTAMAEQLLESEEGRRWLPWFGEIFAQGRDVTTEPAESLVLRLASGEADAFSGRLLDVGNLPEGFPR
jgi:NAD(P)-dependent dehydrogenase (short-subunit alcohol dehydrogenase family)